MPDNKKKKLLYFYTSSSTFVEKDISILSEHYLVIRFQFNLYAKKRLPLNLLRQGLFLLRYIFSVRLIVCQFASLHAFLPIFFSQLFGKKGVLVAGGTDCVSFPSIHYGNFSNKTNARISRYCFRHASLILPVHETLVLYDYLYQTSDFPKQGIRYFIPDITTPVKVIYNGYDSVFWSRGEAKKKPATFVTVLGHVNSRFTYYLKGIDLFIEAARNFPEAQFKIIGGKSITIPNQPANLQLISNIWGKDLVQVLAEHRFYVQLSISEGFPNALSEAMLCECVPLVSAVGAMPFIVEDCGFVLEKKDTKLWFDMVAKALADPDLEIKGKKARMRIAENFTFEKRKAELLQTIDSL